MSDASDAYERLREQAIAEAAAKAQADKEKEKDTILGCLAALLLIAFGPFMVGFTVKVLWAWFMVPLGLPAIGMAHAYGLVLLSMMFRPKKYQKSDTTMKDFGYLGVYCIFTLGFGWLAYYVMTL